MGFDLKVMRSTPPIQLQPIKPASALERLTQGIPEYSFPNSVFAFQGGKPTQAGLDFFAKLYKFFRKLGIDNLAEALAGQKPRIDASRLLAELGENHDTHIANLLLIIRRSHIAPSADASPQLPIA